MSAIDTFSGEDGKTATFRVTGKSRRNRFFGHVSSMIGWADRRMEKRRSRRALLELTDEQLKDIGLSRGEAYAEAVRPIWD